MAIQQLMLGLGASKKTYLDDVYSTYAYKGAGSGQAINNGINLSTEGGLVWTKRRDDGNNHLMFDTESGTTKYLIPSSNGTQGSSLNVAFNSNGYTINSQWNSLVNSSGTYASFTFRKVKGFFDIVTWTGNGSNRTISHSLGSVPGMILIKNRDTNENWRVYHRDLGATHRLLFNVDAAKTASSIAFNNTAPTASVFTVGTDDSVNKNGDDFIAYVFAGGESTAATARSVKFDGGSDCLTIASTSDFTFGTGDFTIEFWANPDAMDGSNYFMDFRADGSNTGTTNQPLIYFTSSDGTVSYWLNGSSRISTSNKAARGVWSHYAIVRNSGTTTLYMNGSSQNTYSDSTNYPASPLTIGKRQNGGQLFDGKISNLRIVKGTAVYTSSFRPPTKPLTNISGTVLLCCNNSSTTGSTVTPGTITASGSPTASSDSPFDDPAAFTFGDSKEGIIKCGSYEGNGSSTGPEINLGWEPQWILIKNVDSDSKNWMMLDSMRGIISNQDDNILMVNHDDAESAAGRVDLTSTGFKLNNSNVHFNANSETYIYMAIRRPDSYVGKPAEAGTDVFTMDTGSGNSTLPVFDSGFPVDLALYTNVTTTDNNFIGSRLTGTDELRANETNAASTSNCSKWDSNAGWCTCGFSSNSQSWMWKRHAGFDVVAVNSAATGDNIPHNLGRTPEMIWAKNRDNTGAWSVYHKGLNGGTNPEQYRLILSDSDAEATNGGAWYNTAPTSTYFTSGANFNGNNPIFILFASVSGISKVGSYSGSSGTSVSTGFQPRFILIKRADSTGDWHIFDSTRGINSSTGGSDSRLILNTNAAKFDGSDYVSVSSTGFTVNDYDVASGSSTNFIYYAHA